MTATITHLASPSPGNPDWDSIAFQRVDANTLKATAKKGGQVAAGDTLSVSKDGQTTGANPPTRSLRAYGRLSRSVPLKRWAALIAMTALMAVTGGLVRLVPELRNWFQTSLDLVLPL
jgi:hypothetical protein